jgi:hypothetical protein
MNSDTVSRLHVRWHKNAKTPAKCDGFGLMSRYFSDDNDLLAEDAVRCEPLSAENSLPTGKITGNSAKKTT